jgi:hypothetical protein
MLHTYSHSSDSGALRREGNIAHQIVNTAPQTSKTVRNRPHVHINVFLRMTDTMTTQNIDLSSWDTVYITSSFHGYYMQRNLPWQSAAPNGRKSPTYRGLSLSLCWRERHFLKHWILTAYSNSWSSEKTSLRAVCRHEDSKLYKTQK